MVRDEELHFTHGEGGMGEGVPRCTGWGAAGVRRPARARGRRRRRKRRRWGNWWRGDEGADAVGRARGRRVAGTALLHAELEVRQLGARLTRVLLASPADVAAVGSETDPGHDRSGGDGDGGGGGGKGHAGRRRRRRGRRRRGVGGVPTVSSTISMALGLEDLPRQLNMMSREMDIYRRRLDAASRSNT